jgi:hypothetical protein
VRGEVAGGGSAVKLVRACVRLVPSSCARHRRKTAAEGCVRQAAMHACA